MADPDPKPRIGALICIVAIASTALIAWAVFRVTHPQQQARMMTTDDASLLLKAPMGAAMFADGKPVLGLESRGLLEQYNDNPEKFKMYGGLFDTAMNAIAVSKLVRTSHIQHFPVDSTTLPPLPQTRDAWNHPYCISRIGTRIAIVSGGPSALSFSCETQRTRTAELAASSKTFFQSSAGELVVFTEAAN